MAPRWSIPTHILYAVVTFSLFFFAAIQWSST